MSAAALASEASARIEAEAKAADQLAADLTRDRMVESGARMRNQAAGLRRAADILVEVGQEVARG